MDFRVALDINQQGLKFCRWKLGVEYTVDATFLSVYSATLFLLAIRNFTNEKVH